ncbi:MAG: hypothetical protein ACRDGG_07360 [Anaerolineae bacterium]
MEVTLLGFIIGFVAILLTFIAFIALVAIKLGPVVSLRVYTLIEVVTIAGILLGTLGMFQPWDLMGFRPGFLILLVSTLAFIVWSHLIPKRAEDDSGGDGASS